MPLTMRVNLQLLLERLAVFSDTLLNRMGRQRFFKVIVNALSHAFKAISLSAYPVVTIATMAGRI